MSKTVCLPKSPSRTRMPHSHSCFWRRRISISFNASPRRPRATNCCQVHLHWRPAPASASAAAPATPPFRRQLFTQISLAQLAAKNVGMAAPFGPFGPYAEYEMKFHLICKLLNLLHVYNLQFVQFDLSKTKSPPDRDGDGVKTHELAN